MKAKQITKIQTDSYPNWSSLNLLHLMAVFFLLGLVFVGFNMYQNSSRFANRLELRDDLKQSLQKLPQFSYVKNGKLYHKCLKSMNAKKLAKIYYNYSYIFHPNHLQQKIVDSNSLSFQDNNCIKGKILELPQPILAPIRNKPLVWSKNKAVKAIYVQGGNLQPMRTSREVAKLKKHKINGIVFDVKDILGVVNYKSQIKEVEQKRQHRPPIKNLPKTIHYLHKNNIYVIARMALFQDKNLAMQNPKLAIQDSSSVSGMLLVKGKPLWVDPGNIEVRRYNLAIVDELVKMGVDEIQFDYIRYPAEGNLKNVTYQNLKTSSDKTKHLISFLSAAWLRTRMSDVKISIDIFGIVAWGEEVDIRATGQRIEKLSPWVDIISPMLYPSHFNKGFDGFKSPADEGLHFYHTGVKKVLERSVSNPHLVVRPWIQAFKWRVSNYNTKYIREQIRGSYMGGGSGWLMWNAGNKYTMVYNALKKDHPEGKPDSNNKKPSLTLD